MNEIIRNVNEFRVACSNRTALLQFESEDLAPDIDAIAQRPFQDHRFDKILGQRRQLGRLRRDGKPRFFGTDDRRRCDVQRPQIIDP